MTTETSSPASSCTIVVEPLSSRGVVVRVAGELDLATTSRLEETVGGAIADGHRHLVFDLSGATFIDCAGVRAVFASVASLADDPEAAVALSGAGGAVGRLLALLEVDRMVDVAPDERRAAERVLSDDRRPAEGWRRHARAAARCR